MSSQPLVMPFVRGGSILIIVAGLSALLMAMSVTFLVHMRSDADEMAGVIRESQTRIMLMAGCNYIQEASRIGWQTSPLRNQETFGWIDVRDGSTGPKIAQNEASDGHRFPINTWARFPMQVMKRPPCAIGLTTAYNPILTQQSLPAVPLADPRHGRPFLTNPDPQPVVANGWSGPGSTMNDAAFAGAGGYLAGDPTPRMNSVGMAWFRVFRDGPATFIITCGGGGTLGFADWNEVQQHGEDVALFHNDQELFETLLSQECRLWYRVEWSAAVMAMDYHMLDQQILFQKHIDYYMTWPKNASHGEFKDHDAWSNHESKSQNQTYNMGGTIRWVQRLMTVPNRW